jgi:hypothetical protein
VAPIIQPNHLPSPPLDDGVVDVHMSESSEPNIVDGGENSPMGALKIHSPPDMEIEGKNDPSVMQIDVDASNLDADGIAPSNGMEYSNDETTNPPPAKRVRKHSDADRASFTHVSDHTIKAT